MTRLPLLPPDDPRLRERSFPVPDPADPSVRAVANRLIGVLRAFRREYGFARGIAAPQIGILLRIIVVDPGEGPAVLVNPEIRWISDRSACFWESCMCNPAVVVMVRRADAIRVGYRTPDGDEAMLAAEDAETASVIQHELDHLEGILLSDRAADSRAVISRESYDRDPDRFDRMCREPPHNP